jgi:hypothetical protein
MTWAMVYILENTSPGDISQYRLGGKYEKGNKKGDFCTKMKEEEEEHLS